MEPGFDFFIGGLEDSILATLQVSMPYVKDFASYGGELDLDEVKRALGALTPRFPLVMVSYTEGEDVECPPLAAIPGDSRIFRHDCTLAVMLCTNDARGDRAQRRGRGQSTGVYKMIADTKLALDCVQFTATFAPEGQAPQQVLLNPEPLKPVGVQYLARLPQLTAYILHYQTYFKYFSPERSTPLPLVSELVFGVENTYPKIPAEQLPGVVTG